MLYFIISNIVLYTLLNIGHKALRHRGVFQIGQARPFSMKWLLSWIGEINNPDGSGQLGLVYVFGKRL